MPSRRPRQSIRN